MADGPKYMGMPIKIANPVELRDAVMNGDFIHRAAGMAFYKIGNKIFVVEADKPISVLR